MFQVSLFLQDFFRCGPVSSRSAALVSGHRSLTEVADPAIEKVRSGVTPSLAQPSETILVVDDDPEVLSLAVDILRLASYTVLGTADPRQALRLACTHPEPIHLLLTDVVMPLMNGLQLATEVQALCPEVKVLLMSAYRTKEIDESDAAGS